MTSLPSCLGQKDGDVLLAMRDQARLVSTAIQLLTSPESSCLHTPPAGHRKLSSGSGDEASAEPCDSEKPSLPSQVRGLDLDLDLELELARD